MKNYPNYVYLLLLICCYSCTQRADLVLTNGNIFTGDSTNSYVEALAVKGNKILAIGSNSEIDKFIGSTTKSFNLEGKTVIPGFNDSHDHFGWIVPMENMYMTDFSIEGLEKNSVLDSLSRLVKKAPKGLGFRAQLA